MTSRVDTDPAARVGAVLDLLALTPGTYPVAVAADVYGWPDGCDAFNRAADAGQYHGAADVPPRRHATRLHRPPAVCGMAHDLAALAGVYIGPNGTRFTATGDDTRRILALATGATF
jgi:hypothetical protein